MSQATQSFLTQQAHALTLMIDTKLETTMRTRSILIPEKVLITLINKKINKILIHGQIKFVVRMKYKALITTSLQLTKIHASF